MNFIWKDYCIDYEDEVEAFFDIEAIKFTSCDEGFKAFFEYWRNELGVNSFWSKVVFAKDALISVIAFARSQDDVITVQEFVVSPEYRCKGYGSMILKEFLECSKYIIGQDIHIAKAVIYPENIASKKAFEKAKFVHVGTHPDGDALYYQYNK